MQWSTSNFQLCLGKKAMAQDAPLYHMIFDGLGKDEQIRMNKSGCIENRAAEMSFMFLCVFLVLFLSKGTFLLTLQFVSGFNQK